MNRSGPGQTDFSSHKRDSRSLLLSSGINFVRSTMHVYRTIHQEQFTRARRSHIYASQTIIYSLANCYLITGHINVKWSTYYLRARLVSLFGLHTYFASFTKRARFKIALRRELHNHICHRNLDLKQFLCALMVLLCELKYWIYKTKKSLHASRKKFK